MSSQNLITKNYKLSSTCPLHIYQENSAPNQTKLKNKIQNKMQKQNSKITN